VFLLWGFNGPFWRLTIPAGIPVEVREAMVELHSWSPATRAAAASRLQALGPAAVAAAPLLIDHLDDFGLADGFLKGLPQILAYHGGPKAVLNQAFAALSAMGPAAVPALIDGVMKGRERVRAGAAELLARTGDPRVPSILRDRLERDPSYDVRSDIARLLGAMHDASAADVLGKRLRSLDSLERMQTTIALGTMGTAEAVSVLTTDLNDPDPKVREYVQIAIDRICRDPRRLMIGVAADPVPTTCPGARTSPASSTPPAPSVSK
jgi:HEAT repeat protein